MSEERMLSVCEIAKKMGRSERYVYALARAKNTPFVCGRAYLSEVLKFLKDTKIQPLKKLKKK